MAGQPSSHVRQRRDFTARLPDDLLEEIFRQLPMQKARLAGEAVQLGTLGSVERVCRRWRRVVLQVLPASLDVDLLSLGGRSMLNFSSFLALCKRLGILRLHDCQELDTERAQLLGTHLCGLPAQLDDVILELPELSPALAQVVDCHLDPAAVSVRTQYPSLCMWFRQLEHCSVHAQTGLELALLAEGLQRAGPIALRALHLADWRAPDARDAAPASVPALANLPRLGTLKCTNCLPESVWLCRHLTRLLCSDGDVELGKQATVLCTGLQQLDLRNCTLPDGVFPAALCSLGQLISVRLIRGQLLGLSPAFSKLRSLRELAIRCGRLDASSMAAMAPLRRLTSLALSGCHLTSLPHGPYLTGLESLELSGARNQLASPLPFAATAARGLRRLTMIFPVPWLAGMECWADLEWKLHCFPRLEALCFEPDRFIEYDHPELEALAELCKGSFPRCRVTADLLGVLRLAQEPSGMPWFLRSVVESC